MQGQAPRQTCFIAEAAHGLADQPTHSAAANIGVIPSPHLIVANSSMRPDFAAWIRKLVVKDVQAYLLKLTHNALGKTAPVPPPTVLLLHVKINE